MDLGYADIFVILLITIGPLKAAIVFAALTAKADAAFRRDVAIRTVTTAAVVVALFIFGGEFILGVFHVSLPALKLAGGLILLLFALHMVMGEDKKAEVSGPPSPSIAVYPLAVPLMATPQGIVAIVTIIAARPTLGHMAAIGIMSAVILAINLVVFLYADRITDRLGVAVLQIVARIVGLLLAGLAVQIMLWGLGDVGAIPPVSMQK